MLIFNSGVIVVAIIMAILIGPLYFFDFMDGDTEFWIISSGAFVIGGLCSLGGLKPRLFYIFPVWLIGLGMLLYQTFVTWGWWGLGALVGGVVGLVVALVLLGWRIEKSEWKNAPQALDDAKVALLEDDEENLWAKLGAAFFIPGTMTPTPEMCEHDRQVLAMIREHMGDRLWPEALAAINQLDQGLLEASTRGDEIKLEEGMFNTVQNLIVSGGTSIDQDTPDVVE